MNERGTNQVDDFIVADVTDQAQQRLVKRWSILFAFVAGGLTLFGLLEVRHLVLRAEKYAQSSLENKYQDVVIQTITEQTGSFVPNLENNTTEIRSHDLKIIALQLRIDELEKFVKEVPNSATPAERSNLQKRINELEKQLGNVQNRMTQTLKEEVPSGQGWIYIGEYDPNRKAWKRNYVTIDKNKPPSQLVHKTNVRINVGGLNVRDEIYIGDVIAVLNQQSVISVERVQPYLFTDYFWAKVTYR